jgi:hypothetical protein
MFTEFVAECRAESLKARPTGDSVDASTLRRKKVDVPHRPGNYATGATGATVHFA